jgi:hypothetical protein
MDAYDALKNVLSYAERNRRSMDVAPWRDVKIVLARLEKDGALSDHIAEKRAEDKKGE